jgi:hypothetical protein
MGSPQRGAAFLREFRAFIMFIRTLWGLLAGISVFFPLSTAFFDAIPVAAYEADGVFNHLSPPLITATATIVTLFVILSTFGRRDEFAGLGRRHARRQAWISMAFSMAALMTYITIHQVYDEYGYSVFGLGSGDPRKLLFEIPLLIAYASFFSLLTRAFMLLGLAEFYRHD